MLRCTGVAKAFGGVVALNGLDLEVHAGEIVGLIGPNGSGKSTLVNIISGYLKPSMGEIYFGGRRVNGKNPNQMRRFGLSRTFQNLRLYGELSALDNLLVGLHLLYASHRDIYWTWLGGLVSTHRAREADREAKDLSWSALETVGLANSAYSLAKNLSYGDQKRLELARATLLEPRLLVLDEPTAGLPPDEASRLMELFSGPIRGSSDRALLIAEHNLEMVLNICTRVAVLDSGRKIVDGLPQNVATDQEVMRVYLGE